MLPMGFGYVERITHDYVRHGTTTLLALNVLNGTALPSASSVTGTKSFWRPCARLTRRCLKGSTCAALSTSTVLKSFPKDKA
jgi:hypothetical protein